MAQDAVKSASLTNLDATPFIENTAGAGASGRDVTVDDFCAATAAGLQSSGSFYKLLRVPSGILIESLFVATDAGPNLSGSALAIDLSWVFSDSTIDGTPTFLQGLIPQSTNTGGTTSIPTYSSPNKFFGTWKPAASANAITPTELTFNGLGSAYSFTGGFTLLPLFQLFGFVDGRGYPTDPDGYFDLLAYVATGATTGGACNIYAKLKYQI